MKRALSPFLKVLIVSGALYSGYLYFSTVRALVAGAALSSPDEPGHGTTFRARQPLGRPARQELAQVVERKERVNILLLGIDQRENDPGPWRTDTMILVSIDPTTNSASMLSIPRDLWVTIPGFGENRVNTAHYLGDARDYAGGGVALAKKTVWHALGVPVHYYVRANFTGFEKLVDAVGGLTINVEKAIHDEEFPDGNYGTMVIDIPAGIQHMDGQTVLQYARSRHGNSDFDRMARQQAVIMAARDKVLSLDIPLSRIPKLLELVGDAVQTDLVLEDIVALAEIAKRIDRSLVRQGMIDDSMTTTVVTPEEAMVEIANWDQVRKLVDDLFPVPVPSVAPTPSLAKPQLTSEGGRILLQNGTLVTGLAQRTARELREKGFNVVAFENADRFDYAATLVLGSPNKQYTLRALADQLGAKPEYVSNDAAEWEEEGIASDIDVIVILGRDYAQRVSQQGTY